MDLIDEEDRLLATGDESLVGPGNDVTNLPDSGCDSGEFFEMPAGLTGHDVCQGGLADPGRTEEND